MARAQATRGERSAGEPRAGRLSDGEAVCGALAPAKAAAGRLTRVGPSFKFTPCQAAFRSTRASSVRRAAVHSGAAATGRAAGLTASASEWPEESQETASASVPGRSQLESCNLNLKQRFTAPLSESSSPPGRVQTSKFDTGQRPLAARTADTRPEARGPRLTPEERPARLSCPYGPILRERKGGALRLLRWILGTLVSAHRGEGAL